MGTLACRAAAVAAVVLHAGIASAQYLPDDAPPPPVMSGPPRVVYGWDPDVPPPDGYALDADINGALLGAGIGLFAGAYLSSVLVGVVAQKAANPSDWSPLYVPVAGPLVAIQTLEANAVGTGALIGDAVMQTAGVLAFVMAFVDEEYKIVRYGGVELTPALGSGAGVSGRF